MGRWIQAPLGSYQERDIQGPSFYKALVPHGKNSFPWMSIYKVPLRAAAFAWTDSLKNILTLDNLRKKHIIVIY